jgi:hypothetical protein
MTTERKLRPVSHWLRRIKDPHVSEMHPLKTYQAAFNGFERLGTRILSTGVNTVNVELEDGNILKIGTRELRPDAGAREFDMPILQQGIRTTTDGLKVRFYIQPQAQPFPPEVYKTFLNQIYQLGYNFLDPGERQVGFYNGEPRLLDPWSVVKNGRMRLVSCCSAGQENCENITAPDTGESRAERHHAFGFLYQT